MAIDRTDLRLQAVVHDVLDAEQGPHPLWTDSPARRRIADDDRTRARRRPLLLLGLAAVLLIGGAVVAGALVQRTPTLPVVPASNGWIAFVADGAYGDALQATTDQGRPSDQDLYIVREGTPPRRIAGTGDGLVQDCPTFSADGRLLAHTSLDAETVQGTPPPQQVGPDGEPQPSATPIVGPARYTIGALWVDAAGAVTEAGLITPSVEIQGCPVPSPDGRRIAYASTTGDIWIAPLNGPQYSVDGTRVISDVAWAPDGSAIAALYGETEIWIVPVEGDEGRHLPIDGRGLAIDWSPDGTHLAVRTETGLDIVAMSGARVGGFAFADTEGLGDLVWSPDGTMIAQVRGDRIDLLTPDGQQIQLLAPAWPEAVSAAEPDPTSMSVVWAPDGRHLAVGVRTSKPEGPDIPGGPSPRAGALVALPLGDGQAVSALVPPTAAFSGRSLAVSWQAVYP